MKNSKYKCTGDFEYKELPVTEKELGEARKKASGLIKKTEGEAVGMRSCWICNPAHYHFLNGKWGNWVLSCFECGKFFYDKIDITEYEEC